MTNFHFRDYFISIFKDGLKKETSTSSVVFSDDLDISGSFKQDNSGTVFQAEMCSSKFDNFKITINDIEFQDNKIKRSSDML